MRKVLLNKKFYTILVALLLCSCVTTNAKSKHSNRALVAVAREDKTVFISWRSLVTDPQSMEFNVYRLAKGLSPLKLNDKPLGGATCFVDNKPLQDKTAHYAVRGVLRGKEVDQSNIFELKTDKPYISVPLKTIEGYHANDTSIADLDGDGDLELVVHMVGRGKDNSHKGKTTPVILQAYELDGTLMWEINLGRNVREGAHYTQFMVYDLDGDGKAEVACKTADGTTDAKGTVIGDANADWRNKGGWILRGPEYLTVFDGQTGVALSSARYIPQRAPGKDNPSGAELKKIWGDGYGNRPDRFLAGVAYLDGKMPSLVMCRGYYTRTVVAAWNWRDGKLTNIWTFDSDDPKHPGNRKYRGQGNHGLCIADVDHDGKDEIIYGAMTLDDNGKGLYSTDLRHGDAMHVTDLDPSRPGLEVFRIQEPFSDAGAHMYDAATGEILWKKASVSKGHDGEGPGRGLSLDIDPRYPGSESWVFGAGIKGLFDCKGNVISEKVPQSCNFGIWWDGDLLREILDKTWIAKWDWKNSKLNRILTAPDCSSNNWSKATPCLSGDIMGDWREEVIWRTTDNKELRIYTTPIPTKYRIPWLMQDRQYRLSIVWQNIGYNQPPHTSFQLGVDMKFPPKFQPIP